MMNCYICGDEIKIIKTILPEPPATIIAKILQPFLSSPVICFLDKINSSEENTIKKNTNEENSKCCNKCLSKINEYDQTLRILNKIELDLQNLYYTKIIKNEQPSEHLEIKIESNENYVDQQEETVEAIQTNENTIDYYSSIDEENSDAADEEIHNDATNNTTTTKDFAQIFLSDVNVVRVSVNDVNNPIYSIRSIYQCSECKAKYTDKKQFQAHLMFHEQMKNKKNIFKCHICRRIFERLPLLDKHLQGHAKMLKRLNDAEAQSSVCSKTLSIRTDLTSPKPPEPKRHCLECPICRNRLDTKMLLKKHMENEHKIILPK